MAPASYIDSPILTDTIKRLVAAYQPERIYLFGSMARGDAGPDSDYDVLVRGRRRRRAGAQCQPARL